MKWKIIILITSFNLMFYIGYSQWFLGFDEKEVMIAAQELQGLRLRKQIDNSGIVHVIWEDNSKTTFDALLEGGLVTVLFIIPNSPASLDSWETIINRDYYKVAPATWKGYQKDKEFYIQYGKMPNKALMYRITKELIN